MRLINARPRPTVSLEGAVVLLTGAAGALGSATARQLAAHGARLAMVDVNTSGLDTVATELRALGAEAHCFPTDLTNDQQIEELPGRIEATVGPVDVLISSAGVEVVGCLHTLSIQEIDLHLAMHLRGPMLLTRAVLTGMKARRRGHIVIVSSMMGKLPTGAKTPYAAAKAGSIAFANSLRRELEGTGIGVSALMPGFIAGAGQGFRGIQGTSIKPEDIVGGSVTADQCASGILKCVQDNDAEVVINARDPRLLVAINAAWPRLADRILKRIGAYDFWLRVAKETGRS